MAKRKKQKINTTYYISLIEGIRTLHGTSHFTTKTGISLLLWTLALIVNLTLTVAFIMVIKQKVNEDQIVTSINSNCKINQVPFPAVSICNFNMVSLKESRNIARILKHYNKSDVEIERFLNALPNLKDYGKYSRKMETFSDEMEIMKHHYFTVDTILEEVHQKCENLMVYCSFNRKVKNCNDMFVLIKTYEGHCCTFNYAALKDANEMQPLPIDQEFEYYDDQGTDGSATSINPTIIATSESGRGTGLSVVFNVQPNDYPSWSSVPYYGVKIIISDPNDYPETTVTYRYITLGETVDMKVEPMVFQSDSNVRRVDPTQRACWFHDELLLGHTDRYSYETCCTECKMRNYFEACQCVPYKYPREKSTRICEFEDLRCLNNVTVHKSKKELQCDPVCYMECRDKKYSLTSDLTPFVSAYYPDEITTPAQNSANFGPERFLARRELQFEVDRTSSTSNSNSNLPVLNTGHSFRTCLIVCVVSWFVCAGVNVSELAALQVFFDKSTCNCYRLTLLIDTTFFIATYGGVFGLSFGGSIITLVELTYLFTSFVINTVLRVTTVLISRRQLNPM